MYLNSTRSKRLNIDFGVSFPYQINFGKMAPLDSTYLLFNASIDFHTDFDLEQNSIGNIFPLLSEVQDSDSVGWKNYGSARRILFESGESN